MTNKVFIPMNRHNVLKNPYQGRAPKVLTVCSAGCLRSPTIANELIKRGYNARCCGATPEYAIVPLTHELLVWADYVITVAEQAAAVRDWISDLDDSDYSSPELVEFDIPDVFPYNDPVLVDMINRLLDENEFYRYD